MAAIEVGVDEARIARQEIDEDELRLETEAVEVGLAREEERVEQQLVKMALQFFGTEERFELEVEVNRLHFLDRDDLPLFVDGESVDATLHRDVPLAHPRP